MFQCRACVWRCIRAIAGESHLPNQLISSRPLVLTPRIKRIRRHASTTAATDDADDALLPGKQPIPTAETEEDTEGEQKGLAPATERQLKLELKYLPDKVKLAEHVHYTLRCDKPEKALDLCRLASKQQDVIVSWNHVINWHMQQGKVDKALKIYNEMKKRAQFPDTYTYSLILHGLAIPQKPEAPVNPANVSKALSIYYSMSSPSSRVKPGIIHTNNVLKVCRAALDLDALWGVVSRMPEVGAGAPDEYTYAIILDAIRASVFGQDPENTLIEALAASRAKSLHEGRAVWHDVIKKWRGGQIRIDERLVVAMGNLLKMSTSIRDWDDVLNLFQQTMNIPRQLPALGSPDRHVEHIPGYHEFRTPDPELPVEDEEGYSDTPTATAFAPIKSITEDQKHPQRLVFVQPTEATLGLLIDICTLLRSPKAARAYWDLLTASDGPYQVRAARGQYHTLMKLHGKNRSSAQTVATLRQMAEAKVEPSYATFRIAMSVCVRDHKNPHYLEHARAIIDIMESTLADPDVETLMKYLHLVSASNNSSEILFTVDRLDSIVHNLRSRISYGSVQTKKSPEQHIYEINQTLRFFQNLIGVMDTIIHRAIVPEEQRTHWIGRRRQLDNFVQKESSKLRMQRFQHQEQTGVKVPMYPRADPGKGLSLTRKEYALRMARQDNNSMWDDDDQKAASRALSRSGSQPDEPSLSGRHKVLKRRKGWELGNEYKNRNEATGSKGVQPAGRRESSGSNDGLESSQSKKSTKKRTENLSDGLKQEALFADSPLDLGR